HGRNGRGLRAAAGSAMGAAMRSYIGALAIVVAGCGHADGTAVGYAPREAPRVRVASEEDIRGKALTSKPMSVPFGEGQDGTQLVTGFLLAAEKQGATYVTDLRIYLVSPHADAWLECRTDIVPMSTTRSEEHSVLMPGGTETYTTMRPVTQTVM